MTNNEQKLVGGVTFSVGTLLPSLVKETNYYDPPASSYCAYIMLSTTLDRLIIQIWDMRGGISRIEIDGRDTFVFNVSPHYEELEGGENNGEIYDYRPVERYGSIDDEMCERYDDLEVYTAIKQLIVELIKTSEK